MNTHSFGILGGDSRFLYLARYLGERGYSVRAFVRRSGDAGADGVDPARFCTSLRECAECTDLVLPLPASSDGANLSFPPDGGKIPLNTVFASVKKGTRVFAGCCSRYIADLARDAGAVLYDYYTSEELLYKNALLTAEGALFEISSAVCRPFLGLGVTVFGYGRIASLLTRRLVLLGSRVNVVCRSEKARAAAWADGARAFSLRRKRRSRTRNGMRGQYRSRMRHRGRFSFRNGFSHAGAGARVILRHRFRRRGKVRDNGKARSRTSGKVFSRERRGGNRRCDSRRAVTDAAPRFCKMSRKERQGH